MTLFFLDPVTLYYWGLSAALHGLFAYATLLALTRGEKQALIWLVMLIAKLWFDFHRIDQSTAALIGTGSLAFPPFRCYLWRHHWGILLAVLETEVIHNQT